MTPAAPTWGEIEDFLKIDGWTRLPASTRGGSQQAHIFLEKVLADGTVLQTHISHSRRGRPSPGRFGSILQHQIQVSRETFWEALRGGQPVDRPAPVDDEERVEHEAWVVAVLARELHMSTEEIAALSVEGARQLVHDHWSRSRE